MKLYEIAETYRDIIQLIDSGEIPEDQTVDLIEQMEGEWQAKAEAVAAYVLNLRSEVDAIDNAIKRMRERRDRTARQADSLATYLQMQMQALGKREIKTAEWTAKLRWNPPAVVVVDEAAIPSCYWREKMVRSVDKALVKDAMQEGIDVPGVKIEQAEKLRIS